MENAYQYIEEQGWEKDNPKSKVFYVNNGVDLKLFNENREKHHYDDPDLDDAEAFKVVYTGSIRKVNNLGLLLDAAKLVENPKVKFLIWGDGDELDGLRLRVEEEQIRNVVFKGRVAKHFVPSIVSRADLNIAHNTPTPLFAYGISFNKLFDYLAAGKPILSDFPSGHNPSVAFGAGKEITEPSAENIARSIESFVSMDGETYQKYSQNALETAEKYCFEELTNKLLSVIENRT